MSSILTNTSAMVALQTLKSINTNLAKTQDEISTGKKIATAKDNAAVWAISKVMETDVSANTAVSESLALAKSTVSVARAAAETVTTVLQEMKDQIIAGQQANVDRATINKDLVNLSKNIELTVGAAQFNGLSLLSATAADVEFVASLDRDETGAVNVQKISVTGSDFLAALQIDSASPLEVTDDATATSSLATIEAALGIAIARAAELGAAEKQIDAQSTFISKLSDAMTSGIGALVDADMEEASARLQALQVQQQLGIQSLSIANQAPQNILSLFQ